MRGKFDTPITFSRAEVGVIRELLNTPDKPILCPKCKSSLTVKKVDGEHFAGQFHVNCQVCNRGGFISMQPRGGSVATN
jgi:hypothetical protein